MNILITGGCGFVGSNIAVALSQKGHRVTCLDNLSRRGSELILDRIIDCGCSFLHADIRNHEDFQKTSDSFDLLIECSAEPSVLVGVEGKDARYLINVNLAGAINCFEFCRTRSIPIIFFSTSRVYPYTRINGLKFRENKTRFEYCGEEKQGVSKLGISTDFGLQGARSLYGATKLCAEYILAEYSTNYRIPSIINRCGVIAGPWQLGKVDQGVFTYWLASHFFKKPLRYIGYGGKGKQVRDLLHIEDLIYLVTAQIETIKDHFGSIWNVGGGRFSNLSLSETTHLCEEITGNTVTIRPEAEERPADVCWYVTDTSAAENVFNWKPTKNSKTILLDIYKWLEANEHIFRKILS